MSILHSSSLILHRRRRRAFTLVELLTVIIIIGLLMALLIPAINSARVRAMDAQVVAEIAELDKAMEQFKDKYGMYPPAAHRDDNGFGTAGGNIENRVRAFWRRAWPRWNNGNGIPTTGTPPPPGMNVATLSPAEVLVFYLGGVSDNTGTYNSQTGSWSGSGSTKVTGFNMNPLNPTAAAGQRTTPLFQFDQGRLIDSDGNGFYEYYPPRKRSNDDGVPPYIYFDYTNYSTPPLSIGTSVQGYAVPYLDGNSPSGTGYMNPTSFQIISAGQDNNFGPDVAKTFPTGTGYATEDYDNLTNFATVRLEERLP